MAKDHLPELLFNFENGKSLVQQYNYNIIYSNPESINFVIMGKRRGAKNSPFIKLSHILRLMC